MKKRFIRTISVLVVAVMALAACQPAAQPTPAPDAGNGNQAETPADGAVAGMDELIVVTPSMPSGLDPAGLNENPGAQIRSQIFETLVIRNPRTLEIEPWLAESWDFEDPQTLHMTLRSGVYFSNGDPLTMEDVLLTFERIKESTHVRVFYEHIERIEVHDDRNLTFHLSVPFVPILTHLHHQSSGIINARNARELLGDNIHDLTDYHVGTGPFKFEQLITGDRTIITRNDNWWGGAVPMSRVTFRVVPEGTTRLIEVETGSADIALAIDHFDVSRAEGTPGVVMHRNPNFSYNYIGINTRQGALGDVRVRQAINYALDMQAIVDNAFFGVGVPATGPLVYGRHHFATRVDPQPPNLERARELMAEAGFADGIEIYFHTNAGNQSRADVAVMVQNMLRDIDIDVTVEILEWTTYLDLTAEGEESYLFMLGWVSNPEPHGSLYNLFHSSTFGAPGNRSFHSNDRLDYLLDLGSTVLDPAERAVIYAEIQEIIREELPHIPVQHDEERNVSTERVGGFYSNPMGHPRFWEVYFR